MKGHCILETSAGILLREGFFFIAMTMTGLSEGSKFRSKLRTEQPLVQLKNGFMVQNHSPNSGRYSMITYVPLCSHSIMYNNLWSTSGPTPFNLHVVPV